MGHLTEKAMLSYALLHWEENMLKEHAISKVFWIKFTSAGFSGRFSLVFTGLFVRTWNTKYSVGSKLGLLDSNENGIFILNYMDKTGLLCSHSCLSQGCDGCCHLATTVICVLTAAFLLSAPNESCNHQISPIQGVCYGEWWVLVLTCAPACKG